MPQPVTTIELVQKAELRGWRFTPIIVHVKNAPKWTGYDWIEAVLRPFPSTCLKMYLILFYWKVLGSKAAERKILKYLASVNLHFEKQVAQYASDPMAFIEERAGGVAVWDGTELSWEG